MFVACIALGRDYASGMSAGELVVTSGQIKLQPNGPVVVDNGAGLQAPAETPKP